MPPPLPGAPDAGPRRVTSVFDGDIRSLDGLFRLEDLGHAASRQDVEANDAPYQFLNHLHFEAEKCLGSDAYLPFKRVKSELFFDSLNDLFSDKELPTQVCLILCPERCGDLDRLLAAHTTDVLLNRIHDLPEFIVKGEPHRIWMNTREDGPWAKVMSEVRHIEEEMLFSLRLCHERNWGYIRYAAGAPEATFLSA